jgi:beta-glucosidase
MSGDFSKDFIWGTATASYQIEGAVNEDGRGPSIWDIFSHTPGKTFNGDTGDIACDHYHRWPQDLNLLKELGVQAYRFSIAWPRVFPEGTGPLNEKGLDFYDQLVNALLEANITPFVTLYHWDLPQALQETGGWANRKTVEAFTTYVEAVARRLGDRVKNWITHNEPWVVAYAGNLQGRHAPGLKNLATATQVSHNLLLSHGRSVPILRSLSPGSEVGITLNLYPAYPNSAAADDQLVATRYDGYLNRWFLDPLYKQSYPEDLWNFYGASAPKVEAGDLAEIATPTDFLGINYYSPVYTRAVPLEVSPLGFALRSREEAQAAGFEVTEMDNVVAPEAFLDLLTRVQRDYNPTKIYITENGVSFRDELREGKVDDPRRVNYLKVHIEAVKQAIQQGVPIEGYFEWSLLDNFEWAHGYSKRFGLVYVDYATQQRIPKSSFYWYKQLIESNRNSD